MTSKLCACCGNQFQPRSQVPNQAYCSSPECQRARKRRWQQDKLQNDADYRGNQRDAQRAWQERHPDYCEYAERRGIQIVRTCADEGKSGLRIDGRQALQKLIKDVETGVADFRIV